MRTGNQSYASKQPVLLLDESRNLNFHDRIAVGVCPYCNAPTQYNSVRHYRANVERFDLNLVLWTGQGWGLILTTTNFPTKLFWL